MNLQDNQQKANQEREERAKADGVARAIKARESAAKRGEMSSTQAAHQTVEEVKGVVIAELDRLIDEKSLIPKRSSRPLWHEHLNYLDTNLVATIGLRVCFDAVGANWTYNNLLIQMANAINGAILTQVLKSSRDGQKVLKDIANRVADKKGASMTRRQYALFLAGKRKQKQLFTKKGKARKDKDGNAMFAIDKDAYYWREWDKTTSARVGAIILTTILSQTNLFETYLIKDKATDRAIDRKKRLKLTPGTAEKIEEMNKFLDGQSPQFGPMFNKPYPWGKDSLGPYDDLSLATLVPPVKHMGKEQEDAVRQAMDDGSLDNALEALNTIQETAYEVNKYVYVAVKWVWHKKLGHKVSSFPNLRKTDEIADLAKAEYRKLSREAQMNFKAEQLATEKHNLEVDANNLSIKRSLGEAKNILVTKKKYPEVDRFYLPHQWDSRSRVYHTAEFGHHNADYLRSMFSLANKTEINEGNAMFLALQLANTWGNDTLYKGKKVKTDKLPLEARQQWAEENLDQILAVGEDFKATFDYWSQASDPFQFLAACREYAMYCKHGNGYMSGLPIALDATQSGIQVYCAMTRNAEDAEKVNLVPLDEPGDLYEAVVEEAVRLIDADIERLEGLDLEPNEDDDEDEATNKWKNARKLRNAKNWKAFGLNRKTVKRNVMTWAYSSRQFGFTDQLMSDLMEPLSKQVRLGELDEHPFGEDGGFSAASYLGGINERATSTVVKSAADGMKFFQSLVRLLTAENKQLHYTTPMGFPMMQNYRVLGDTERVEVPFFNRATGEFTSESKATFRSFTSEVDADDARQACSPNLVHSLDASVLMQTALNCKAKGVTDIVVVHDSFAVSIGNVEVLAWAVRRAFVDTFKNHDPYQELLDQNLPRLENQPENPPSVPERPEQTFDLEQVMLSEYAFS